MHGRCWVCRKRPGERRNRLVDSQGRETGRKSPWVCFQCYQNYLRNGSYRHVERGAPTLDPKKRARAERMLAAGQSQAQVARILGMCRKTVRTIQRELAG